ncbi:uncharacterized protein LOC119106492 isoform X2 [Pollicipes pollicipes]|uniref:uncharacterized protein LOC119106492 isoform X2 n=1 Tax=Pollicipes pollicipes TaxID=41117 RepID=UPI001884DF71|nr:uncharacterized protein LOC119106492 isoform X2 [Pollicipes pollicipes]
MSGVMGCRPALVLTLALALVLAAAAAEPLGCMTREPATLARRMYWRGETVDLRLQVSDRSGSHLVAWLFKLFLRELYGYGGTVLVRLPDSFNMSTHLESLSDCPSCPASQACGRDTFEEPCRMPPVTINLEAWAPASYDLDRETAAYHGVIYAGRLGPSTRIGWFLQESVAGLTSGIVDHWRAFQRPGIAQVFNYTELERRSMRRHLRATDGRYNCEHRLCHEGLFTPSWCRAAHCAVLLASSFNEASYILRTIEDLRLLVQVFWVGNALSDLVTMRTTAGRPVLFAHYTPSLLTLSSSYVEMAFPACPAGTVCPTGNRFLKKLAWNRLEDGASMAHKALIDFHLTQRQYEDLLRLQVTRPDLKYSEVACDWMRRNAEVISRQWLMHGRRKNEILIGGIFPISGSHYRDRGIIPAVMMAIRAINSNTSILQDYKLTLMSSDGQCSSDMVMKSFINYLRMPSFAQMVGILGPACSNTLEPIAGVSRHFRVLVISYSAEGVLLTNRSQYPYFFRTIGENKQFRFVYKQLLAQLKWKRVASLTENGQKYSEYISIMHDMLQASGVTFIANRKFPSDTTNMATYLKELKDKKARIIIADMYQVAAKAIMCEAYLQNMTARQGYIWFLPEWFWRGWYNTTANSTTTSCTSTQLMEVGEHAHLDPDPAHGGRRAYSSINRLRGTLRTISKIQAIFSRGPIRW